MSETGFFRGRRVLITGHTGFKGAWLSLLLLRAGAEVTGYALEPEATPNLYSLLHLEQDMHSVFGDIRDGDSLTAAFSQAKPEIVIHLAAQPLVRESYRLPRDTFEINAIGTVNLLECVRRSNSPVSVLNVTTDKVYKNEERNVAFCEDDALGGFDPYSASKACSEIVTQSYRSSFLGSGETAVSTARAGNVIGGGDFARDRILPDCIHAAYRHEAIIVRNPYSVRPYQHVLDPLDCYLTIVQRQLENPTLAGSYNIGPDACDCVSTGALATLFCQSWGEGMSWEHHSDGGPHEANFLKLDCTLFQRTFAWSPRWHIDEAVNRTVEWAKTYRDQGDIRACMMAQIQAFYSKVQEQQNV
jgi:CDP-glucose 4,6-dehydratase